jgi:hypothetical protein
MELRELLGGRRRRRLDSDIDNDKGQHDSQAYDFDHHCEAYNPIDFDDQGYYNLVRAPIRWLHRRQVRSVWRYRLDGMHRLC